MFIGRAAIFISLCQFRISTSSSEDCLSLPFHILLNFLLSRCVVQASVLRWLHVWTFADRPCTWTESESARNLQSYSHRCVLSGFGDLSLRLINRSFGLGQHGSIGGTLALIASRHFTDSHSTTSISAAPFIAKTVNKSITVWLGLSKMGVYGFRGLWVLLSPVVEFSIGDNGRTRSRSWLFLRHWYAVIHSSLCCPTHCSIRFSWSRRSPPFWQ